MTTKLKFSLAFLMVLGEIYPISTSANSDPNKPNTNTITIIKQTPLTS